MAVDLPGFDQLDFAGGMTGLEVAAPPNQVKDMENLDISDERKPKQRAGSRPIDAGTYVQAETKKLGKINALLNFDMDNALLIRSGSKLYKYIGTSAAPVEIQNQQSLDAFNADIGLTTASTSRFHKWKNHALIGAYDYSEDRLYSPIKQYTDSIGVDVVVNASLPSNVKWDRGYAYMLSQSLLLANDLKAKLNTHFASGTAHPAGIQTAIGTSDASDLDSLLTLTKAILNAYNEHARDARLLNNNESALYHGSFDQVSFGHFNIDEPVFPVTLVECAKLLNTLKINFYIHINAFNGRGVPDAITANSRGVATKLHGALTAAVSASSVEISGSNTDGFSVDKTVPIDRIYEIMSFLRTAYNGHLGTAGGTGGHVLVDSANYAHSTTIDSTETLLLTFWEVYIGYYYHALASSGIVHSGTITDPEKLATYTTFVPSGSTAGYLGEFSQLPDSGYITNLNIDYSSVDLSDLIGKILDLTDKLAVHVALSRHTSTGAALSHWGDYYTIVSSYKVYLFQYKVTFKNSYKTTDGTEYTDEGAPYYPNANGFPIITTLSTNKISSSVGPAAPIYPQITYALGTITPGYGLAGVESYPTNYTKVVYRTKANGDVFYKVGEGVSDIVDNYSDTSIEARGEIYSDTEAVHTELPKYRTSVLVGDLLFVGDVEDNSFIKSRQFTRVSTDTLGCAKHGLSLKDALYVNSTAGLPAGLSVGTKYFVVSIPDADTFKLSATPTGAAISGYTVVSSTFIFAKYAQARLKNRLMQALPTTPFFTSDTFYLDLDHNIKLLGHARGYPIVVCDRGVYRIEGSFDSQGNGSLVPRLISDRVFGVGSVGGITVDDKFYFCSMESIWMTDGFSVTQLTPHLKDVYRQNINPDQSSYSACNEEIKAIYNPIEMQIYFSLAKQADADCSELWVIHLDHLGQLTQPYTYGPFTRYSNAGHFYPSSLEFWRGRTIMGTKDGYIFEMDRTLSTDPRLASGVLATDGATELKQNIPYLLTTTANNYGTNTQRKWISRVAALAYNHGNLSVKLRQINDLNTTDAQVLKEIRFRQEYPGIIKERRGFSSGGSGKKFSGFKAMFKQLELSPLETILYKSDDVATADISGSVVTLTSGNFPADQYKGDTIYFGPSYTTGYVISSKSAANALTLASAPGNASAQKWVIKGYPRDEFFELIGLSFYGDKIEAQQMSPTGNDGENG